MMRISGTIAAAAAVALSAGCATAGNSPSQKVLVWSDPAGATIRVNGVEQATTPAVLSLPGDRLVIQLSAPGFVPDSVVVTRPGAMGCRSRKLAAALVPRPPVRGSGPWQQPPAPAAGSGADSFCGPRPDVINLALAQSDTAASPLRSPWQTVPVGTTVRLWRGPAPRPDVAGTVAALAGDTLIIESRRGRHRHAVPASTVTALEVGLRDRKQGAVEGAGAGLVLGCVAAGVIWAAQYGLIGGGYGCVLLGSPLGMAAGALLGVALMPAYEWRTIPPPRR
jgi:hypothetical protein